jgi:ribonuclease T1
MNILRCGIGVMLAGLAALSPMGVVGIAQAGWTVPGTFARTPLPLTLPTVPLSQLPPEARDTLVRIRRGPPFRYRQDGTIFSNRERRLPQAPSGYYREYTVPTPGAQTRGARRLVLGNRQEIYYTPDHYRSFMQVRP